MANLPAELVDDIILRLPVKPLLRFRCVSKPWLALIDSPEFIKLHLNRSIETRNNRILILVEDLHINSRTYSLNLDSEAVPLEIDHPLKNSYEKRQWGSNWFKGSCNGLMLISYRDGEDKFDDINFIWNPSTRNYHRLPFAEFDSHIVVGDDVEDENYDVIENVVYGIGYDSVHDDYKVVRMIVFLRKADDIYVTEVKVYSLKSNMWRRIQDFPHYIYGYNWDHGVLSGGALHWLVTEDYHRDDPYIAAFNLASEEFHFLPMPPNIKRFCMYGEKVEVLEGCLCICNLQSESIDVWVMKCYGVIESWTKLVSVDLLPKNDTLPYGCNFIVPLALSKDGAEVLFMHTRRVLIWVDLQREVTKRIDIHGLCRHFHAEFVTQSLVPLSIGSGTNV